MDYSKLNTENKVVDIIVINDSMSELDGIAFALELTGHSNWILSDKEGRKNIGSIGSVYDSTLDAFITEQPHTSWELDSECLWQPPVAMPIDDNLYNWNETEQTWDLIEDEE